MSEQIEVYYVGGVADMTKSIESCKGDIITKYAYAELFRMVEDKYKLIPIGRNKCANRDIYAAVVNTL